MKTVIKSVKGSPLRRVLCSFLFGAAAFCVVPTNGQAPGDIVWVTTGNSIAEYNGNGTAANGTAINTNFITEQAWPSPGGILVSGPNLYVPSDWWACCPNKAFLYALQKREAYYVLTTYDAVKGNVISSSWYTLRVPFVPTGMAQSSTNVYVANQQGGIAKGGDLYFINSTVTKAPYALAVGGPIGNVQNVLHVTNNAQNENGYFYISTYDADNGTLLTKYFIQIATSGLYGLALQGNTLYVSVYSGIAPGVYTYNATTGGQPLEGGAPFVPVKEPWGIAIGSPPLNAKDPTLYVASYQDSMIYEFDATSGGQPTGSIKVNAPTNITVKPANEQ